jgi:hypothetical protein
MRTINNLVIEIAKSYVGQKEKPNNSGFIDPYLEEKMISIGWAYGWAWCSLFTELIWKEAYEVYDPKLIPILNNLFNVSAVKTFSNFNELKDFEVNQVPEKGSIVIWQNYKNFKPLWTGHAGIVTCDTHSLGNGFVDDEKIDTVEGNTNALGGREGDCVAEKIRTINFEPIEKGLVMLGFIHPLK